MSGKDILHVFPSRMLVVRLAFNIKIPCSFPNSCRALSQMKIRLSGAQKGHRLLKKKADALSLRFRIILSKIIEVRRLHTVSASDSHIVIYKIQVQ